MKRFYKAVAIAIAAFMTTNVQAQDETKYVKVETDQTDWSGEYLIVYEADDENNIAYVFDGSRTEIDKKNNFFELNNAKQEINGAEVRTINSSAEADGATFTITKAEKEGLYNIKSKSGYWIGFDSTEKDPETGEIEPNIESSNETPIDNSIAMQEGKTNIVVTSTNGFELRFNADEGKTRFRYHASGKKKAIKFYKKTSVSPTTAINTVSATTTNTQVYDLQGRSVSTTQPGHLYIENGKKVIK